MGINSRSVCIVMCDIMTSGLSSINMSTNAGLICITISGVGLPYIVMLQCPSLHVVVLLNVVIQNTTHHEFDYYTWKEYDLGCTDRVRSSHVFASWRLSHDKGQDCDVAEVLQMAQAPRWIRSLLVSTALKVGAAQTALRRKCHKMHRLQKLGRGRATLGGLRRPHEAPLSP